ncbi:MAG: hypothetical protein MK172_08730 [Verrucomicrobiales bacterium]|nr:hypothetical protein [Verrucomicrobiales bacterium]
MDKRAKIYNIAFLILGVAMMATVIILAARKKSNWQNLVPGQWPDFSKPRGIRNNNPGNIRASSSAWQGKIPLDLNMDSTLVNGNPVRKVDFEQFTEYRFGIRAMIKLLKNYQENEGLATIRGMITRWAPPFENNTSSYVTNVANKVGIDPDSPYLLTKSNTKALIRAMSISENGHGEWISDNDFNDAWELL